MLFLVFQFIDLLLYIIIVVFCLFIPRFKLEGLLVMVESIGPIAQLFVVTFLSVAAFIERVPKVVMTPALQTRIGREQRLAKRLQRLAVIL